MRRREFITMLVGTAARPLVASAQQSESVRRIGVLNDADPDDRKDWPRQHEWLAKRLNDMHRVFNGCVRALDADTWRPEN
jgi:hypothetical protein